ncbi:YkgJ family cysteine cluster protein [Myxococcota bacterium]
MNCQLCGACCFSDSDTYVPVNEPDRVRLGEDAGHFVRTDGRDQYLKMRSYNCIALAVQAGIFVCTIYDRRPEICRELERGSPACREEFEIKKDRARRVLHEGDGALS